MQSELWQKQCSMLRLDSSAMTQALDVSTPRVTIPYSLFYTGCSPVKATTVFKPYEECRAVIDFPDGRELPVGCTVARTDGRDPCHPCEPARAPARPAGRDCMDPVRRSVR